MRPAQIAEELLRQIVERRLMLKTPPQKSRRKRYAIRRKLQLKLLK
jgi:hypothetical protein